MKSLKLLSFSLITLLFVGFLTACLPEATVLNDADNSEDTIDVDVDGENAEDNTEKGETLKFNPDVSPEITSGVLVPTGFDVTSVIFASTMLGSIAAVRRRKRG